MNPRAKKMSSDPYGVRTHVAAVKGRCPRPLDEGAVLKFALILRFFNLDDADGQP